MYTNMCYKPCLILGVLLHFVSLLFFFLVSIVCYILTVCISCQLLVLFLVNVLVMVIVFEAPTLTWGSRVVRTVTVSKWYLYSSLVEIYVIYIFLPR